MSEPGADRPAMTLDEAVSVFNWVASTDFIAKSDGPLVVFYEKNGTTRVLDIRASHLTHDAIAIAAKAWATATMWATIRARRETQAEISRALGIP